MVTRHPPPSDVPMVMVMMVMIFTYTTDSVSESVFVSHLESFVGS